MKSRRILRLVAAVLMSAVALSVLWRRGAEPKEDESAVPAAIPTQTEPAASEPSAEDAVSMAPSAAAQKPVADAAPESPAADAVFKVIDAVRVEESDPEVHAHRLQYWKGRIDPPVTAWKELGALDDEGETPLPFALPDGSTAPLKLKRLERFGPTKGVYVAKVEGHPFAEAYFSYVNQAVSGVIRYPDLGVSWEIRNAGDGSQYFEEVDLNSLGECAVRKEK